MTVQDIYSRYQVPRNLQIHMLQVASLAQLITKGWHDAALDQTAIIGTCLFHDIAKPIMFDLDKQATFAQSAQELEEIKNLITSMRTTYGTDEHVATVSIFREIGLSEAAVRLVSNLEWEYIPRLLRERDIECLVPIYCDLRISPKGIQPMNDRLSEWKSRVQAEYADTVIAASDQVEKLIATNTTTALDAIRTEDLDGLCELMKLSEVQQYQQD